MKKQLKGTIQLTLTALIWGVAFVAQSVGMNHVGPFTFTCLRFMVSATLFQQYGIIYSSVGKAGFITSLYIIIVPFLSVFLHKRIGLNEWISALIAVAGFYIMSISGHTGIGKGDILLLICAFLFSMQIMTIDSFIDHVDPVAMSCVQFIVSFIIAGAGMFILERPSVDAIIKAAARYCMPVSCQAVSVTPCR